MRFTLQEKKKIYEMVDNARRRAKRYNREFTIRVADVMPLVEEFCRNNRYSFEPGNPWLPSIDRIDNNKGYTKDNIRIVWYIENLCRNKFSDDVVLQFCHLKLEAFERQKARVNAERRNHVREEKDVKRQVPQLATS